MSAQGERHRIYLLLTYLLLSTATSSFGQSGRDEVSLRTTTRVVDVSVVVTDANGQPVEDLRKTDFTILDDGHPQQITFFSPIDNSVPVSTAAALPGPNTYTNNPEANGDPPSVTIFLFDTLNSKWTSQGYGLNRVRDFLRQIRPEDHIGVYVLGDDLIALHRFNRNAQDLIEAMHRYDHRHDLAATRRAAEVGESPNDKAIDRFLLGKDNRNRYQLSGGMMPGHGYAENKLAFASQMTTASLEAIARELSAVSGRKTLIWVTDSRPVPMKGRPMKRIILYLACLLAMISTSGIAGPQSEPLFSLRLAAPKRPIKPGAELHLFVTVKNTSDRYIKVVTSPGAVPEDWFRYKIRVTDAQGGTPPPAADVRNRDKRVGFYYGSTFARDLRPGESFVDQITVTRFYDLTRPGKYSVSVARPIDAYNVGVEGVAPGKVAQGSVRSNTVTVTVTH